MRFSRIGPLLVVAVSAIACSPGGEADASSGSDLTGAAAGSTDPLSTAAGKVQGAWLPKADAGGLRALTLEAMATAGHLDAFRDFPHAPTSAEDKAEVDRLQLNATITSVTGDASGTLDFVFTEGPKETAGFLFTARRVESYSYQVSSEGGTNTLVLTQTNEKRLNLDGTEITDRTQRVDLKAHPLRPRLELAGAPSYCVQVEPTRTAFVGSPDCGSELLRGIYQPASRPPGCDGFAGTKCTACRSNRCIIRQVSSCEHAGNVCTVSAQDCEGPPQLSTIFFTPTSGVVVTQDSAKKPIDCNNSPTGKSVCCKIPIGADRTLEDDEPN